MLCETAQETPPETFQAYPETPHGVNTENTKRFGARNAFPFCKVAFHRFKHPKMAFPRVSRNHGIEPWTFEQHVGEAILIPAGCPYQTRNLKSGISITLEFVSPENLQELIRLSEQFRLLPKGHMAKDDKLEARKLLLYAANRAVKDIRHMTSAGSEDF
ncbi:hypothetical protein L7F22_015431 [Adiantum nelumboides]|nr:hypothetical protein [Adiantum nelumboides]